MVRFDALMKNIMDKSDAMNSSRLKRKYTGKRNKRSMRRSMTTASPRSSQQEIPAAEGITSEYLAYEYLKREVHLKLLDSSRPEHVALISKHGGREVHGGIEDFGHALELKLARGRLRPWLCA